MITERKRRSEEVWEAGDGMGTSLSEEDMRQGGRVFSAALYGRVYWPWSMKRVMRSQTMGIKDLATDAENEKGKGALFVGIQTGVQSYHIENE